MNPTATRTINYSGLVNRLQAINGDGDLLRPTVRATSNGGIMLTEPTGTATTLSVIPRVTWG